MGEGGSRRSKAVDALLADDDARFVVSADPGADPEVVYCAPGLADRLGVANVEGRAVEAALGDHLGAGLGARCRECLGAGEVLTHLGGREDGPVYETELSPVREDGPTQFVAGTVSDVTEREQLREELDRTAATFDAVLENVPVHLYVKDREARTIAVSDFYVEHLPFVDGREDLIGKTDDEIFPWGLGVEGYEDDRRVIEENDPLIKKENHLPSLDMWTLTSKIPWVEDGETRGLVGITLDVTKRKQYARSLERKTEQLEQFASIISHDLQNPLKLSRGYLDLARETGEKEHFETAERSLDRALDITNGLGRLVRASESIDPDRSVDAASLARRAWEGVGTDRGTLSVADALAVDADRNWLRTLFENLFRNAVEHADEGVRVKVDHLDGAEGFYVADDGPGIPEDRRNAVFESGETTKDGDATGGIGLWIVARIADAHGWEVSVAESRHGGARIEVVTDPEA